VEGDFHIDGVPRPGAQIMLEFLDPGGSVCPQLLPTGRATDMLELPGIGAVEATLLDAATPMVLVRAEALGLTGAELPEQVDGNPALLERIEALRAHGAVLMGLASSPQEATANMPSIPKIALVGPSRPYVSRSGSKVSAEEIDFTARCISMGRLHQSYPATAAVATAVAGLIPGTVVNQVLGSDPGLERSFRFGHTSGTIELGASVAREGKAWIARASIAYRTARRLMEGAVLVPEAVFVKRNTTAAKAVMG
jgi:2-methylaconitate cis-trans-isomerase PrpF